MSAKKIINNLYLGDKTSIPKDADLVISCAEELYYSAARKNNIKKLDNNFFWTDENHVFFNFKDFPTIGELDINLISQVVNLIIKSIKKKKVYVHCVWGVNRSASLVFIALVFINKLNNEDFDLAYEDFEAIYPYINPNYGWWEFLVSYFPYTQLALN